MGHTLSVTLSDCFMNKKEKDVVIPLKLKFYCRYVDDTYNRRSKNRPDELFERMNKYHPNINLTVEINPMKFLVTNIYCDNNEIKCSGHWTSVVPKHYKKNVIIGGLHPIKNLSSNRKLK